LDVDAISAALQSAGARTIEVVERPAPPGPVSPRFVKILTEKQRRNVIQISLFKSVADVFEQPVLCDVGFSVVDGIGPRSLGTIRPATIHEVIYEADDEKWDYRLGFYDADGRPVSTRHMKPCAKAEDACPVYRSDEPFTYALETLKGKLPAGGISTCPS
jgi:hypothetical protein